MSEGGSWWASPIGDVPTLAAAGALPPRLHRRKTIPRVLVKVQQGRRRSNEANASHTKMHGKAMVETIAKSEDIDDVSQKSRWPRWRGLVSAWPLQPTREQAPAAARASRTRSACRARAPDEMPTRFGACVWGAVLLHTVGAGGRFRQMKGAGRAAATCASHDAVSMLSRGFRGWRGPRRGPRCLATHSIKLIKCKSCR